MLQMSFFFPPFFTGIVNYRKTGCSWSPSFWMWDFFFYNSVADHTPWKINMERSNHPFRKEHDLSNLHDYVPAANLQGCKCTGLISTKNLRVGTVDLQRYLRESHSQEKHLKNWWASFERGPPGRGGWFLKENKLKTWVFYSVLCTWRVWHEGETHFCSSWQQTPTKIKKTKHDLHKTCMGIKTTQNKKCNL